MAEYITKKAAIKAVENAPIELFQSEWEEIEEAAEAWNRRADNGSN